MAERQVNERVRGAISAVLPRGLATEVTVQPAGRPGLLAVMRGNRVRHRAVVAWAGEGWPADVAVVMETVPDVEVVVARDLSIGAREALAARAIGWIDETGRANVSLPTGLVVVREVTDRPPTPPSDSWSASAVAVAEAVLTGVEPRVDRIQAATGLSRGATANALAMFERREFLDRAVRRGPGSVRHVVNAPGLLDEYASAAADVGAKVTPLLLHRLWRDPLDALANDLAPALDRLGAPWAVTGAAAGALLAPYLSTVAIVELYLDSATIANRAELCAALDARPVERGHRIEARPLPNRVTANGPIIDGIRCAPPARIYADLRARGGRSAEAAHHLQEVLGVGTAT